MERILWKDIIARNVNARPRQNVTIKGLYERNSVVLWNNDINYSDLAICTLFTQKTGDKKWIKDFSKCFG